MPKTSLLPYQRRAVREVEGFDMRALICMDPGLGKTIVSLSSLARNREIAMPAVVVCPAVAKYVWESEAKQHCGWPVTICEGMEPPKQGLQDTSGLVVINYDILKGWVRYLRDLNPQTIIFDECQNLVNRQRQRTRAARALAATVPCVFALSGTPLMNRPAELWPVLNILRPDLYPAFWPFAHRYCAPKRRPWGWEYKGAARLDELNAELRQNLMLRYRKSEVLKELPPKFRATVACPLTGDARAEYRKASTDFMSWLRQQDAIAAAGASRAPAMTMIGHLLQLVARLKFPLVVNWANQFLIDKPGEKLILFGYHRKMIEALQRRVKAKSVVIYGGVTGRARQAAIQQFQTDKRTRVAINQLQAGGVAATMTAATNVAFTQLWWRPGDFVQAGDRIHRIGQTQTTYEHWLICPGTIEEKLCKVLEEKQAVLSAVLDGGSQDTDLDVYTRLMLKIRDEGL